MSAPDFRSRPFLVDHVRQTLAFYHPRCIDPDGGFFHFFRDDGTVYDTSTRHLVSSTRFVVNFAMAWRHLGERCWRDALEHGVAFLRAAHRDPCTGGYAWVLSWERGAGSPIDATNHCYGLAFVVLAYAHAVMAGMAEARADLEEAVALLDDRFWEPAAGLYADEASPDWSVLDPYRGQNANMHACEAMLAAWEATRDVRFLDRAETLARNITVRQAKLAGDLVWEHYHADWSVDWEYNRHDRSNIFRPWGYQRGHLAEWAKLLLILERDLERHRPAAWLLPRAEALFDAAVTRGWDAEHGGMFYGFGPDGAVSDDDKYFWVQAETLAAAALLGARTGEAAYWSRYDLLWAYCWEHFVDHRHGAWYRILARDNRKYSDEKSPAGKVDYHTMGACWEVLNVLP
jgi:mannose/cellobiose epimerase-like protein (N-acyl-D-glucosamine 2-epimerase family)